jgi:predicted nucleic acid-binding protein
MIVVDASAVIELLLQTPRGTRLADRIADERRTLHAPHVLDLEVSQVLRKLLARGKLERNRAQPAFDDFLTLRLQRYDHERLLPRIWSLRENLSAYDAAYIALAESLGAPLFTLDARIAKAPGHQAKVKVLA